MRRPQISARVAQLLRYGIKAAQYARGTALARNHSDQDIMRVLGVPEHPIARDAYRRTINRGGRGGRRLHR